MSALAGRGLAGMGDREIARELRTLRRQVDGINRRLAQAVLSGKVKPGSQDGAKRTLRLVLGEDADGKEVLSPPVRWQQPGAGTFKMHATPADNEQMTMISPSGTIGTNSMAVWGTFDDNHAAPSDRTDDGVIELGASRIDMRDDALVLTNGGVRIELGGGEIVTHGRTRLNDGSKKVHRKDDLDDAGDKAVDGADEVYA